MTVVDEEEIEDEEDSVAEVVIEAVLEVAVVEIEVAVVVTEVAEVEIEVAEEAVEEVLVHKNNIYSGFRGGAKAMVIPHRL